MKTPNRTLDEVRDQFLKLHQEVGTLATDVFTVDVPRTIKSWWRHPLPLSELEKRLDKHFTTFMDLDADLVAHANPPSDLNTALLFAARFQVYFGVRDSVRGLLSDTSGAMGSLRNQADFRLALTFSVIAILVALVSALVDVGLLKGR